MKTLRIDDRPAKLAQALAELGRIDKTIHALTCIADENKRRRILTQLNRGADRHKLARAVFHGAKFEQRYVKSHRISLELRSIKHLKSIGNCQNRAPKKAKNWGPPYCDISLKRRDLRKTVWNFTYLCSNLTIVCDVSLKVRDNPKGTRVACDSKNTIHILIGSDKSYILNCWYIYATILATSVGLTICLRFFLLNDFFRSLSGLLANGLIFPLVPKHLQRAGGLKILQGLYEQCGKYEEGDPHCKRIADNVDAMLRARGGV